MYSIYAPLKANSKIKSQQPQKPYNLCLPQNNDREKIGFANDKQEVRISLEPYFRVISYLTNFQVVGFYGIYLCSSTHEDN